MKKSFKFLIGLVLLIIVVTGVYLFIKTPFKNQNKGLEAIQGSFINVNNSNAIQNNTKIDLVPKPLITSDDKINNYKRVWYQSILCSYNCKLEYQMISNKSVLFPNKACVTNCSNQFSSYKKGLNITKDQLSKDDMITNLEDIIKNCQKKSINPKSKVPDNNILFTCIAKDLNVLKDKYPYVTSSVP